MADNSEPGRLALPLDLPPRLDEVAPPPTDAEVIEHLRGVVAEQTALIASLERDLQHLSITAGEDVRQIAVALGLGDHARPYSPSELVGREIIPTIERLALERGSGKTFAVKPAGDTGIPEIDLGGGRKAQLVGRKLPDEVARQMGLK